MDAEPLTDVGRNIGVRLRERIGDQRLDAAKALGKAEDLYLFENFWHTRGGIDFESQHGTETAAFPREHSMAWMVRQTGIENLPYMWMMGEKFGDMACVLLLLAQTQRQSFEAA